MLRIAAAEDLTALTRLRRAAAEYCARTLGWKRIECTEPVVPDSEERRMRTIESINDEILKELEKVL